LTQADDLMHIPPDPHPKPVEEGLPMTLKKEVFTRSVFDRLNMSKTSSAKAVEATFNHSMI
jgi:hypothetical protein